MSCREARRLSTNRAIRCRQYLLFSVIYLSPMATRLLFRLLKSALRVVSARTAVRVVAFGVSFVGIQSILAQSSPFIYSVVNGASGVMPGQAQSVIAQGSLFVCYGYGLGKTLQNESGFPIPQTVGGTSIRISAGGSTYNALMIYSSESQAAAILPSAVPVGDGMLTATVNGLSGNSIKIHIVNSAFGIFTGSSNGVGAGVITAPDGRLYSFGQPAHPGDVAIMWGTGLGPVNGVEASGLLPGNQFNPELFVGSQRVNVEYAGRSGCCAGLDQIVFDVPNGIYGCFVPIAVRSNGITSNFVSVPVAPPGQPCSDPVGFPSALLSHPSGGGTLTIGTIALGPIPILQGAGFSFLRGLADRLTQLLGTPVTERELSVIARTHGASRLRTLKQTIAKYGPLLKTRNIDPKSVVREIGALTNEGAAAGFTQLKGVGQVAAQFGSILPPPGTCTVSSDWPLKSQTWRVASLARDAGSKLTMTGPLGNRTLTKISNGEYQVNLGSGFAGFGVPAGTYSITASGGRDVGAFTANLTAADVQWTNKRDIAFIDRTAPLTITWSGASGYVLFGASSSATGTRSAFVCVEDARKGVIVVPDFVLEAMPITPLNKGTAFLAQHPLQSTNQFSAQGIDFGYYVNFSSDSTGMEIR